MNRRDFLKLTLGIYTGISLSCGGGSQTKIFSKSIKFGLGQDPERTINAYDPDGKRVLDALKPEIVCMWINGGRDSTGNLYTPSLSYIREWAQKNRYAEWSSMGYELMVITWENYDGQSPTLGMPTFGDWHISDLFLEVIEELSQYLKEQYKGRLYFALATEQSTYTACRYDRTCSNPLAYSDRINSITAEYYNRLRDRLLEAQRLLKTHFPDAHIGMCFGGWLVEFEEGINFINYFEPVIREGTAVFFQSMMDHKASENNGYGNPERILKNAKFFYSYGKPVHLAHYMPNNKRADVVADDASRMWEPQYLGELSKYLSSFSFMDYGVIKDNLYGSLDAMIRLRQSLKNIN
ncbi:MAG: hypothetical protein D6699_07975 [Aquificota bacterium]|nr:MAG: hypothetical protein D6699_07975 [Aquificota bacterium]